jgi:non-specific serine/threonine protein kinase
MGLDPTLFAVATPTERPSESEASIVVLPFDDISPSGDNEYFSDGLTEEIITDLSKVHVLRVISRTSAMKLKETDKSIQDIGRQLNVQYVLEGSVRKAGNDLRITAQLIDARDDSHVWAEKYTGTLDDVFDMQEKVSRSIVDALKVKLSPEEDLRISLRPIDNARAYEYYLRARKNIYMFTEEGLESALEHLQKGIDIVGDNALLYAGMGFVYWQYFNTGIKVDEGYLDKAEAYADKIFEMEPGSQHGHMILGLLEMTRGDPQQSINHFKHVLAFDPNNMDALHWLSVQYANVGRTSAAVPLLRRLEALEPLTDRSVVRTAWQSFVDGRFEEALNDVENFVATYPEYSDFVGARMIHILLLVYNRQFEDAVTMIDKFSMGLPRSYFSDMLLFMKYAMQKNKREALAIMTPEFETISRRDWQYAWMVAAAYALLSEKDIAVDWLESAVDRGFINYPFLSEYDPFLASLHGKERFEKLMERVESEWENFEI